MSQADDLRFDTLTFLTVLHTHDAPLLQQRFLLPRVLTAINAQLTAPEPLPENVRRRAELGTQRLRFIHFLCDAAHLVAKTGRRLKPTLRVARWLAASPLDQLHTLFDAAYPVLPNRPHDELWRTYRLPGYTLTSPTLSLAPLFDILRQMHADERLKLTTLLKLVPLVDNDRESPDSSCAASSTNSIGLVSSSGTATRSSNSPILAAPSLTAPMLSPPPCRERVGLRMFLPEAGVGMGVRVQLTNPKLTLSPTHFRSTLRTLRLRRIDQCQTHPRRAVSRLYQLDRDRVQRALQRGLTLDGLLRFFENLDRRRAARSAPSPTPRLGRPTRSACHPAHHRSWKYAIPPPSRNSPVHIGCAKV